MSTIYRAYYNTTGCDREIFFKTFEAAKKFLQTNVPGVDYYKGEFFIGDASCKVSTLDNEIRVRQAVKEGDTLYYCGVEPFELPFELKGNNFWKLSFVYGYVSTFIYDEGGAPETVGYFPSKKAGRRYAARNKSINFIARAWITQGEEAERVSTCGSGQDYLSLRCIRVCG